MTTDTKPIMPLEETIYELIHAKDRNNHSMRTRVALDAAIHHLKAVKRVQCSCDNFREAQQSCTDNEMYGSLARNLGEGWQIGCWELPRITFCPWCGGTLPTPEQKGQG